MQKKNFGTKAVLKKAFECQIFLGFFLPCHNGNTFLFNCSTFNNCRDHSFKLNIPNTSRWLLFACFCFFASLI